MTPPKRRQLVAIALAATLAAAWFAPEEQESVAPAVARAVSREQGVQVSGFGPAVLKIKPRFEAKDPTLTFATARWEMPRANANPKATPQPTPAAPEAPPLPFVYMGRYESGGDGAVFLTFKDRALIVREGDVIEEQYRVTKVKSDEVEIEYLPLSQIQTIKISTGG
jgi:hypothetical protein